MLEAVSYVETYHGGMQILGGSAQLEKCWEHAPSPCEGAGLRLLRHRSNFGEHRLKRNAENCAIQHRAFPVSPWGRKADVCDYEYIFTLYGLDFLFYVCLLHHITFGIRHISVPLPSRCV